MFNKNNDNLKSNDSPIAIKFEKVAFGYDKSFPPLITNLSFNIKKGEYVCIVGSNGSGKSTISKILIGLLKPWSGLISIDGVLITQTTIKKMREEVGIVFQNPDNQFVGLSAEDDIAFGLENKKINPTKMWEIIKIASSIVNIDDLLELDASYLSGGQKQKVAITSVLAMNPNIIIFDESTSLLDPTAKKELKELMLLLKTNYNKTIISVTHDMEEIVHADRVMVINKGQMVSFGDPKDVFSDKEFLLKNKLDVPFSLELSKKISDTVCGFPLVLESKDLLKNINNLCKRN